MLFVIDATLTNNIVFRGHATEQMRINSNGVQLSNRLSLPVNNDITLGNSAIAEIDAGYRIFQITNPDGASGSFRIYIGDPASFGNQVFWMSNSLIVCRKPLEAGSLQSNYINTVTDTDLVFARNGVGFMRLKNYPNNLLDFTDLTSGSGMTAPWVYANAFASRSPTLDTVFYGGNTAGDGRVEIFKYDRLGEQLDFNTVINNTGRGVIGNLIDTTVSDENFKYDIEDFNEERTECIKNVKIKIQIRR